MTRRQWKLRSVHSDARRKSHSFCKAQIRQNRVWVSMGLVVVIWCYPCSPCSYFSKTYCDLWYRWVYYNGIHNAEWKPNMQDMQEGVYPKKKKKSVDGKFAGVKYRPETYWWTQNLDREDYGVDSVLGNSFFLARWDLILTGRDLHGCHLGQWADPGSGLY